MGLRGNGELITAHFASLARIVEEFGKIDAISGGSSGSISSFFLKSLYDNPLLQDCAGRDCSEEEKSRRIALMMKSIHGYIGALSQTDLAEHGRSIVDVANRIREEGIPSALFGNADEIAEAIEGLSAILNADSFRRLLNQELLLVLKASPSPVFHARQIVNTIINFGTFTAEDQTIVVQPGLLDFGEFAIRINRVGSFLAGDAPVDRNRMQNFLTLCAEQSVGKVWRDVAALPAGDSTCGDLYSQLVVPYRAAVVASDDDALKDANGKLRIDGSVAAVSREPLSPIVATSLLTSEASSLWADAQQRYRMAGDYNVDYNFDDIRFGYWGKPSDLETIADGLAELDDAGSPKDAKFYALGGGAANNVWREVLQMSPAEPGLARFQRFANRDENGDLVVSAGGWPDLAPTRVLRALGCEKVVYVTRRGGPARFGNGMSTLLGAHEDELHALYDLDEANGRSSLSVSIREADGVWCTNWDAVSAFDIDAVAADAFNAPLVTSSADLTGYANARDDVYHMGCVPAGEHCPHAPNEVGAAMRKDRCGNCVQEVCDIGPLSHCCDANDSRGWDQACVDAWQNKADRGRCE